ncbi:MAG: hypothetical protein O3B42_05140 [Actinomycetota bacterium]|nr:hypothetical protein [Actinomycetota bacterium]
MIATAAVLAIVVLVNLYGWITRDVGCVDPFENNIDETVRVLEGPNGECSYGSVNR